jgi:RNA polymerase sigma-70 factor, ECF subfamily
VINGNWGLLVEQIKSGESIGVAEAYYTFEPQIRKQIRSQLGSYQLSDRTNEAFLGVVEAIREANIREPARLRGFVKTVVARKVLELIGNLIRDRRIVYSEELLLVSVSMAASPEELAGTAEKKRFVEAAMQGLKPREEEILRRFYLWEELEGEIRDEMHLTGTQFRLLKSRSLDRLAKISGRLQLYPAEN